MGWVKPPLIASGLWARHMAFSGPHVIKMKVSEPGPTHSVLTVSEMTAFSMRSIHGMWDVLSTH